ncbi:MAG: gliding motility-associated C-terminal domain-containing protein, partial [Bacteroidales bacterium]|nr:gliding motility-associated C-terminal domain-containing protein [Bacteroidales bacterium]
TILVTNSANGCTASDVVTVTQDASLPTASAGVDQVLNCTSSSVNLNGSGSSAGAGYSYSWSTAGGNIVSGGTTTSPVVNAAGTYTILVTNSANGCTASDVVTVTNNTTVPLVDAGENRTLDCNFTQIQLDGTGTETGALITYNWTTTDGNIVSGATTLTPLIDLPGSYTLVATNSVNGCYNSDDVVVNENVNYPVVNAGNDQTLNCLVTSLSLDGSGSVSGIQYTYLWTTTDGNIVSGSTSNSPLINQPGTYTLLVTDINTGCWNNDMVVVTADINLPGANAGADSDICSGEIINIGQVSNPDYEYSWFPATGLSNSNISNPNFQVTNSGTTNQTYNIVFTVTNTINGCTSTDAINIDVFPNSSPAIAITADNSEICEGEEVQFTANITDGGSSPVLQWMVNGMPVGSNSINFNTTTLNNGDIVSCSLISSEVCADVASANSNNIVMTVGSTFPVDIMVSAFPGTTICEGDNVVFTAIPQNPGLSPVYSWTVNGVAVGTNSTSFSSSLLTNGDIVSCTLLSSETCVSNNNAETSVTTSSFPDISFEINPTTATICRGSSVIVSAVVSGGNGGPYTITNSLGEIVVPPFNLNPQISSTFYYTATDGCSSTNAEIQVNVVESPEINVKTDVTRGCMPLTVTFTETNAGMGNDYTWDFGDNENNFGTGNSTFHTYESSGFYTVSISATNEYGCVSTEVYNNLINVYENPVADFWADQTSVSIFHPEVNFFNNSENASHIYWNFGDGFQTTETNPSHTFPGIGEYFVEQFVRTEQGCLDSTGLTIFVNDEVTFYAPTAFSPNQDQINDEFRIFGTGIDEAEFVLYIYDRWGEIIFTSKNIEQGWDGKVNSNKTSETGSYTWLAIFRANNGIKYEKAGCFTLLK